MNSSHPYGDTSLLTAETRMDKKIGELDANILALQKQLAASTSEVQTAFGTVNAILGQLTERLLGLEKGYLQMRSLVAAQNSSSSSATQAALDNNLKVVQGQIANLNTRFCDYEIALANIKNLSFQRDRRDEAPGRHPISGPVFAPLKAKGCTEEDMNSEWAAFWSRELHLPFEYRRKFWEYCYVSQILHNEGKLREGARGLGFACGEEPLPSLFAKYGVQVLATDLAPNRAESQGWIQSGQHITGFKKIRRPDICPDPARLATLRGAYVDMNAIPADLNGQFDFCWSLCSVEHLGSIANGLKFIVNALRTLKPGGISIHTLEFNIKQGPTIETGPTVLFQRHHLVELAARLHAKGFEVYDFDFDSGRGILDGFVDLPPFVDENYRLLHADAHLKVSISGFICTSFGFVVKKPL